jgi:hypothetical protein
LIWQFWDEIHQTPRRKREKPVECGFAVYAIQFPGTTADSALWSVTRVWNARFTDIAFFHVVPADETAQKYNWPATLKLNLLPPCVGERVAGFGYPSSAAEVVSRAPFQIRLALNPSTTVGRVTHVFEEYRDRGLLNFPCFKITARFDGGMSGGPLFNEAGELCGIICAGLETIDPDIGLVAHGATLWPAMGTLLDVPLPGLICKGPYPAFELSTIGVLHSVGWNEVVGRIEIETDPSDQPHLRLKAGQKGHPTVEDS